MTGAATAGPAGSLLPIAVLASGRGTNLGALIEASSAGTLPVRVTLAAGDRAGAPALRNAEARGIPTFALDPGTFATRRAFDEALFARVAASGARLVVLAGFMRILDAAVTTPWTGRMLNIHPSLLPKYRGLHTHRRVLAAGDSVHGVSVHFVNAALDEGPVVAQARIDVLPGDTEESLADRLLPHEHRLLVACVAAYAHGRVVERGGRVWFDGRPIAAPLRLDSGSALVAA